MKQTPWDATDTLAWPRDATRTPTSLVDKSPSTESPAWKRPRTVVSSFYWASAANAPNLLQPYWLIVLPLDVPDLTANLLWGPSGQRWRCLWTFLFSNVPTFATSRLQEILASKGGTTWARNGRRILPENARLLRNIQGSFTCRKSTTWDRRLYFPSEGRRAEDFFALKNPTASVGFEPANLGTKGQHATSRRPQPQARWLLYALSALMKTSCIFSLRSTLMGYLWFSQTVIIS